MNKPKFKYNAETRQQVWMDLCDCESQIRYLKCIVQNEMELTEDNWYEWVSDKKRLFRQLNDIQQRLKSGYDYK